MKTPEHTPPVGHPSLEGISWSREFLGVARLVRKWFGDSGRDGVCPPIPNRWNPASGRVGGAERRRPSSHSQILKTRPEAGFHLVVLLVLFLTGCVSQVAPIETGVIERTLPEGPVRGRWAKVHLDQPRVDIVVTKALAADPANPPGTEARLVTVANWAEAEHTTLAVNANFFGGIEKPAAGERDPGWFAGRAVDLRGLSVSAGTVVSPPRVVKNTGDPALVITRDHRARVAHVTEKDLDGVVAAVAGIGPPDSGKAPGTLLVTAGRNTGETAQVQPAVRHPRTAAGVSADGRTLILLVVDGRQPTHSIGVTLPELADLMIGLGAHDALNLDGGGSSTFIYRRPDGTLVTNQAPGATWRPVGNHLGVKLRDK